MTTRTYLSIGDVLSLLREEFPDITISKIRFLESQGLVNPERSPSGYRKFYEPDVERLRWVLRQQREHFLPLKVIRDRLVAEGEDVDAAEPASGATTGAAPDHPAAGPIAHVAPAPGGRVGAVADQGGGDAEPLAVATADDARAHAGANGDAEWRPAGDAPAPALSPVATLAHTRRSEHAAAGSRTVDDPVPSGFAPPPAGGRPGKAEGESPGPDRAGAAAAAPAPAGPASHLHAPDPVSAAPSSAVSPSPGAPIGGPPTGRSGDDAPRRGRTGPPAPGTPAGAAPTRSMSTPEGRRSGAGPPGVDPGRPAMVHPGGPPGPGRADDAGSTPASAPPSASSGDPAPPGRAPSGAGRRTPRGGGTGAAPPAADRSAGSPLVGVTSGVSLTLDELCAATGLGPPDVAALESFSLVSPLVVAGVPYYDEEALTVANLVAEFGHFGVEPRHLRLYRNAVDREMGLIEQIVTPLLRQRNPESRQRAVEATAELARLGQSLRASLLRRALRDQLGG